jgi:hypothetical protein
LGDLQGGAVFFLTTLFSGPWAVVARFAALGIAIAGIFGYGWIKGNQHGTEKLTAYQAEQALATAKVIIKQGEVTETIRTKYVDRVKTIKEAGDAIIQAVPIYITTQNDSACVINRGAQRLHDSAAANTVPATASGDNDSPTKLTLSVTLGTVAANYQTYHQVAARLVACQDWIAGQFEAANGVKLEAVKPAR